jgi:type IX secretion system PorP/SprF family membrane protein
MKKVFTLITMLTALAVQAQLVSYDYYAFRLNNMYNVNPAYSAKGEGVNVLLGAQSQNRGVAYNNKNYMVGAYSLLSEKQAIGGRVISDTRGAFQSLRADVSYTYIAQFSDEASLAMGVNAGLVNNNFRMSRIANSEYLDQSDPNLTGSTYNTNQFVAGAGLLFNFKGLDVSLSLPHILTTNQTLNNYIHAAAFYDYELNEKFTITPWINYQNIPITKDIFGGNVKAEYLDIVWAQAGYQTNKSFNAAVGVSVENIGISYGFRFSNNQYSEVAFGTHELSLSYCLGSRAKPSGGGSNDNSALFDVVIQLDRLLNEPITEGNREQIKTELEKIKQQLQQAELDNSTPEQAKEVEQQLDIIDQKLRQIEEKLKNE